MEEKVLIKGEFGGKFLVVLLYIVAALTAFVFIVSGDDDLIPVGIVFGLVLVLFAIILNVLLNKRELVVTNKRVIARGAFGYRTDLPTEKVTNVSTYWFGGIGCGSPSSKIRFLFCKNKVEIFDVIISESLQRDSKYQ